MLFKNYKKMTDEELMSLPFRTDSKAFNEIYTRYSKRLLNFLYYNLNKDKGKAEDLLQDLFLKIIEKQYLFDSNKQFKTWIYTIALNLCKNEYKAITSLNNRIQNFNYYESQLDCSLEQVNDFFIQPSILENALNKLDAEKKEIIILRYYEGLKISEISEIVNIPVGTVKSSIFYSLKLLSNKLKCSIEKE